MRMVTSAFKPYQLNVKIKFYEMAMTDKSKASAKSKTINTIKIVNGNFSC